MYDRLVDCMTFDVSVSFSESFGIYVSWISLNMFSVDNLLIDDITIKGN